MKLMTFNILQGGINKYASRSRIDLIINVIRDANPDFVALQEAHDFERNNKRRLREISKRTGLKHCDLFPGTPHDWDRQSNVANLSSYQIKERYKFPGCIISGGALLAVINSPIGELSICNLHLNAHSEDIRLEEIEIILEHTARFKNVILLGDFNSLSRDDEYDPETLEVEYSFEATDMLKMHYVDVASHLGLKDRSTFPTLTNSDLDFTKPLRVDYIFVSPSLEGHIKDVAVIKTSDSEKASDHYPIVVTLGGNNYDE